MIKNKLIISCEHGGNYVPDKYLPLFQGETPLLKSHSGYDIGALKVAKQISYQLSLPLFYSEVTRLLVDLNRSENHPKLYSKVTKNLSYSEKKRILNEYYLPYRNEIENIIDQAIQGDNQVFHFSIHSFTNNYNGKIRTTDIGILYDPGHSHEKELAIKLQKILKNRAPQMKIHRNRPYRGTSDGFTTYLRNKYPENKYIGIEMEVNQKYFENENSEGLIFEIIIPSIDFIQNFYGN